MKKKISFYFVVCLWLSIPDASAKKKDPVDFFSIELSIQQIFREIRDIKDDSLALEKHRQIEEILTQTLTQYPSAYKYRFDSISMIGKIFAPRKAFRVFNWNHSLRDGTHHYFALIVLPGGKETPNRVIRLTDMSDSIAKPDQQVLGADEWFGCLYYKIIPKRKGKDNKTYYTLLGLDLNNLQTKKKIIEILSFDGKTGEPSFGAPIIELNKWMKHRAIFEFAASQHMHLEYNCWRRRIEYDHLAPLMPYLVGEYEYYEPDQFRDGLKFKKGIWKHYKDISEPPANKRLKKRNLPKPKPIRLKPAKDQQEDTEETEEIEEVLNDES